MPTMDQVRAFFEILFRIVVEIGVLTFAVLFIIGWLKRTWKWTFKNEDNEIELKVERKD